jgi:hypothetical protein
MKLRIYLLIIGCFISVNLFAQTPKAIEVDLAKSFKRIDYWATLRGNQRSSNDITLYERLNDSLEKANTEFGEKLQYYTAKYPSTINQKFTSIAQKISSLPKDQLQIVTSADGLFRIYSWDVRSDGSEYGFDNVIQYKSGNNTISKWVDDPIVNNEHLYVNYYDSIYTLKVQSKTYYLAVYSAAYTHLEFGQGIQVFAIENGKLNDDVKVIKTQTGLHSQLYCEYIYTDGKENIYFDSVSKTIHIPVVLEHGKVTNRYITYKFTGQYFEKVK